MNRRLSLLPRLACDIVILAGLFILSGVSALAAPAPDQSITYQQNAAHDGFNPASKLVPPLTLKWRKDLTALGASAISYPLIAQGLVVVTLRTEAGSSLLVALDETNGRKVWSVSIPGTYGFADAAYDAGRVFVIDTDGLLQAFDAAAGGLLWSVKLPNQYFFTSAPTAVNGLVYVGGAGSGGTLYAVDETNGNLIWTGEVENGDASSPAVVKGYVYVSYACPQSYCFQASNGRLVWHYSGPCEGGGGATPVVHLDSVYVRLAYFDNPQGLILDARTGAKVGGFDSDTPPAFVRNLAVELQSGTLRGLDTRDGSVRWSFAGDGSLSSVPVIVNKTIYIGSYSGMIYGLNSDGQEVWSASAGAPVPYSNEGGTEPTFGFGSGDGLLVVPAGAVLSAFGN